jgi:hypothetical protein
MFPVRRRKAAAAEQELQRRLALRAHAPGPATIGIWRREQEENIGYRLVVDQISGPMPTQCWSFLLHNGRERAVRYSQPGA